MMHSPNSLALTRTPNLMDRDLASRAQKRAIKIDEDRVEARDAVINNLERGENIIHVIL